jgi:hypothetical protein
MLVQLEALFSKAARKRCGEFLVRVVDLPLMRRSLTRAERPGVTSTTSCSLSRATTREIVDQFEIYLRERLAAYPALTAVRLWRELNNPRAPDSRYR